MDDKIKNIAFWILILIIVGLSIYLIYFTQTESYECISNPLVYGVSKVKSDTEFTCSCGSVNTESIIITKEGIQKGFNLNE